uniref:Tudor domain-containing protein n=1 Tax=Denticeps clupeoides TaxID=299321 RepID=A0AAY4CB65_9TELE
MSLLPQFLNIFFSLPKNISNYNILHVEIQNAEKKEVSVKVGELCLVEDALSGHWFRGRVQNQQNELFDVFLIDYGNVLTVKSKHLACATDELLMLPPKVICGFFANVLPVSECWDHLAEKYFLSLIGSTVSGFICAFLPHKVLLLEAPGITGDLIRRDLGKYVNTDMFLMLVEMLVEVPVNRNCGPVPDMLIDAHISPKFLLKPAVENIYSVYGPKLTVGKKERVRITGGVSQKAFYCQMTCMEGDLEDMAKKLTKICESRSQRNRDAGNLGLMCSVKGKDDKWHRGFIHNIFLNAQVRVMFVDYGFCELVEGTNIAEIPSDFLMKPIMAFPCAMSCLNQKEEVVNTQQMNLLKKGLLGEIVQVHIDDFDSQSKVYFVTLHNAESYADQISEKLAGKSSDELEIDSSLPATLSLQQMPLVPDYSVQMEEFQEGAVFEGYVEHVHTPSSFWLRTATSNQRFEDMMMKLTEYFSGLQLEEEVLEDPVPGAICCAMYEKDRHYYRAIVTDILEHGSEVFFIDFGNTEKVPSMLVKKLPKRFATEPGFALNCSLVHVIPVQDVWTMAANDFFRQAVSNKALLVHVVHKRSNHFLVDLHEKGSHPNISITDLMTSAEMAENWKNVKTSEPTDICQDSNQRQNSLGKRLQSSGQIGGPEKTTVPEQKQNVISHAKSKSENTTKQAHNQMEIFRIHKYAPGSELEVCCSQINSPSDFWCQNLSKISTLDKLMHEMQVYYKNNSEPLQPCAHVCAAKLKDDGRWYRGYILAVNLDMYKVVFVDYGLTINETMHNLQTLPKQFIEIEAQGFRCSLYNLIEPKDAKVWDSSAARALRQFVSEGSATVTCIIHSWLYVTNMGLYNVVDLCKTSQKASTHLVEKGLAVRMATPKQLVSSTCPLSFFYSSFDLEIGSIEKVYVTHVGSPWEIYLQLDRNGEQFENLLNKIAEESAKTSDPASVAHPGNMWLAKYVSDGKWYRAIRKPVVNDQIFEAFFIDYGNRQVVEKGSLRIIPRSATALLLTPMQAVKCSLLNVTRGDLLAEVNKWLDNAICNKAIQATIVAKGKDGSFVCDLFDEDTHINEKVRELIRHGKEERAIVPVKDCNENVKPDKCSLAIPSNKKYHSQEKAKEDTRLNLTVKAQTRKSTHARPLLQAENQKASPPHSTQNRDGTTSKCTKSVVKPEMSTVELTKFSRLPGLKLNPGFRGTGFVSHMNSVNNFYIQLEEHEWKILKMVEELNSSLFRQNTEPASGATIGDLIAAEFDEDNALYRAVVIDDCMATHFKVAFVDYGNVTSVEKKNTLKLTGLFLTQPRLSIPCCLATNHGFADNTSFETAVDKKPLTVEFIRNLQAQWEVKIENDEKVERQTKSSTITKRPGWNIKKRQVNRSHRQATCVRSLSKRAHKSTVGSNVFSKTLDVTFTATDSPVSSCLETVWQKEKAKLMIGLECLVKLSSSEQWCRAAIHQVFTAEQKCMVYLLDHGTTETADVKFLRKLCPDLRLVPPRTVCCKLNGFDETWKEADMLLKEVLKPLMGESVRLMFVSYSETLQLWNVEFIVNGHLLAQQSKMLSVPCSESSGPRLGSTPDVCPNNNLEEAQSERTHPKLLTAPVQMDVACSGFAVSVTTPDEFCVTLDYMFPTTETVSNVLENLPNNLAETPMVTFQCSLRGIRPAQGEKWSDDATNIFQESVCGKKIQKMCLFTVLLNKPDVILDFSAIIIIRIENSHLHRRLSVVVEYVLQ